MKKIALLIFTAALTSVLAGCVSGPSYNVHQGWIKQDTTNEEARRQLFDCQEKAKINAERDTQIGGLTESCMILEGYKWGTYKTRI